MNGNLIIERNHAEVTTLELRKLCPEAIAIVLLTLHPQRMLKDAYAPLFPKEGPLS